MKHAASAAGLLALLVFSTPALAHPPDSIAVSIDSTQFLSVEVHHPVKQWPSDHFVKQVTVTLNSAPIITQDFKSQSSQEWQYVYYRVIDAKPGDRISVSAECSLFGKLTVNYVVPTPDAGGG